MTFTRICICTCVSLTEISYVASVFFIYRVKIIPIKTAVCKELLSIRKDSKVLYIRKCLNDFLTKIGQNRHFCRKLVKSPKLLIITLTPRLFLSTRDTSLEIPPDAASIVASVNFTTTRQTRIKIYFCTSQKSCIIKIAGKKFKYVCMFV
jgi:hypothetical protein